MFTNTSDAEKAFSILQKKIDTIGAKTAADVIHTIHTSQPTDAIVSTKALSFAATESNVAVETGDARLVPTEYALGQLSTKAGVPSQYMRELATSKNAWERTLAADILSRHYQEGERSRMLTRSVNGQLRGFLSDKFRRLDSRPLIDALTVEADKLGAIPYDGSATETRVALKVLIPNVIELFPGEFVVAGAEWSNSDFGNGAHSFRSFFIRCVCLNGATSTNVLREVHLGGRLHDDVSYSDRTYRLDTAASVSALRDVVRGALSSSHIETLSARLRASHAQGATVSQLRAMTKTVGKETQRSIVDAFTGPDVLNLPAGDTMWRASNAVSWIARHTQSAEKRLDLERLAGNMV